MLINPIFMPLDYGAGIRGTDLAPEIIMNQELMARLSKLGHSIDIKRCRIDEIDPSNIGPYPKAKYLHPIAESCCRLAGIVDTVLCKGGFPLVLGGDHSILLGSLAGVSTNLSREGKRLGVIYIDAHGDFNTSEISPSGNIHGESLSASCGYGLPELVNLYRPGVKVDSGCVCIIGARSLDKEEKVLLSQAGVTIWTSVQMKAQGIRAVVREAASMLSKRCDKIHLSFDIDSVDPAFAPGTGIRVPGGLTDIEALTVADVLFECGMLCSADVVELNPGLDQDGRTAVLCRNLIAHLMGEK